MNGSMVVIVCEGGKSKDRLPVYCTTARPDIAKELGFVGAKIPCPYGPSDGDEGLRKNVEFYKVSDILNCNMLGFFFSLFIFG